MFKGLIGTAGQYRDTFRVVAFNKERLKDLSRFVDTV